MYFACQGFAQLLALDEDDVSRSEERLEPLPVVPLAPGAAVAIFGWTTDSFCFTWLDLHFILTLGGTGEISFWLRCPADEQHTGNCL